MSDHLSSSHPALDSEVGMWWSPKILQFKSWASRGTVCWCITLLKSWEELLAKAFALAARNVALWGLDSAPGHWHLSSLFSISLWTLGLSHSFFFSFTWKMVCAFSVVASSTCYWPIERPRSILGSRLIPCVFHLLWSFLNTNLKNLWHYCASDHGPSYSTEETTAVLFEIGLSSPQPFHASVENVMKIFRIAFVWLNGSQWRCFCALGDIWRCLQTFFGYYS